jgi:hypothetical protein
MQRTGFWRRLAPVAGIDPRALAAPRIGLGAVLLIDLWMRTGRFKALYTDAGVFPRLYLEPCLRRGPAARLPRTNRGRRLAAGQSDRARS